MGAQNNNMLVYMTGLFASFFVGIMYSFGFFKGDVVAKLNEATAGSGDLVETYSVAGFMGQYAAFIPGLVFDCFGGTITIWYGCILAAVGYAMIGFGVMMENAMLIIVALACAGQGSKAIGFGTMLGSLSYLPASMAGIVSGTYLCADALGTPLILVIAYNFISVDQTPSFFIVLGVTVGAVGFGSSLVYKFYANKEEEKDVENQEEDDVSDRSSAVTEVDVSKRLDAAKTAEEKTVLSCLPQIVCLYLALFVGASQALMVNQKLNKAVTEYRKHTVAWNTVADMATTKTELTFPPETLHVLIEFPETAVPADDGATPTPDFANPTKVHCNGQDMKTDGDNQKLKDGLIATAVKANKAKYDIKLSGAEAQEYLSACGISHTVDENKAVLQTALATSFVSISITETDVEKKKKERAAAEAHNGFARKFHDALAKSPKNLKYVHKVTFAAGAAGKTKVLADGEQMMELDNADKVSYHLEKYTKEHKALDRKVRTLATSAFAIGNAIGRLVVGYASDLTGNTKWFKVTFYFLPLQIVMAVLLCCFSVNLNSFTGAFAGEPGHSMDVAPLYVYVSSIGFCFGGMFSGATAYCKKTMPAKSCGVVLGFALIFIAVGSYVWENYTFLGNEDQTGHAVLHGGKNGAYHTLLIKGNLYQGMWGALGGAILSVFLWFDQAMKHEPAAEEDDEFSDTDDEKAGMLSQK